MIYRFSYIVIVLLSLQTIACGGSGSTAPETPSATVDYKPVAVADSAQTSENTEVSIDLAENDAGLEDSPAVYSLDSAPSHGSVSITAEGNAIYTPNANFDGTDTFTYQITDADGDSASATVSINVTSTDVADTDNSNSVVWPAINSAVTTDVDLEVEIILADMTLAEKVGQMVQAEISSVTADDVRDYNLGSVLNGGGSWPNKNKLSSVADWLALADSLYQASTDTSDGGVGVPVIWGTDAVHGHNNVIGATIFPHNIGLGATNNPSLMSSIGEATALEVVATGIDWVFAPTLAVVRNDRWGRTYEGYSEDPEIVNAYAGKIVEGLQGTESTGDLFDASHVVATAKHFIGDGGTANGIDQGNTLATEQELLDIHAQGYLTALESGVQTVMASFSSWQGSKLHGSDYLLTEVLRNQMGFDGYVIGDWNGHGQVPGCSNEQCAQAINAGVDMMMVPFDWKNFISNTIEQVQNGDIAMSRVDQAVRRILRVKARAGLFNKGLPSSRQYAGDDSIIGSTTHRTLARQAVRESLVLLKNTDSILPLNRNQNVLVAGSGANNIGQQTGGWTITWQGTGNSNGYFPGATSVFAGIEEVVNSSGGTATLSINGSFTGATPDVAIVVFGESPYAEGMGDLDNLEYQSGSKSDLALLKSLREKNIPVVSIFLSGRPLWVNKELNASNAFVAAWLPGSEGGGIADVIFKAPDGTLNYDFTGKLSYSWPRSIDQTILNRNDAIYDPLFAYGFGLTYQDTDTLGDSLDETGGADNVEATIFPVPGLIEAESYATMLGIKTESTSDIGGGTNVGYIDAGDWLEYQIDVQSAGSYLIEYRLASLNGNTGFNTLINGTQVDSQSIPTTGGWQSWITQSATVDLQAGLQTLRIEATGKEWNMNWIRFTASN
jgi:beta-glucosidase